MLRNYSIHIVNDTTGSIKNLQMYFKSTEEARSIIEKSFLKRNERLVFIYPTVYENKF